MKIKIKGINVTEKTSKAGKKYKSVGLLIEGKTGDQWVNGFFDDSMRNWEKGTEVDIKITTNEVNGKTYFNFENLNRISGSTARIDAIEKRLDALEQSIGKGLNELKQAADPFEGVSYEEAKNTDVSF